MCGPASWTSASSAISEFRSVGDAAHMWEDIRHSKRLLNESFGCGRASQANNTGSQLQLSIMRCYEVRNENVSFSQYPPRKNIDRHTAGVDGVIAPRMRRPIRPPAKGHRCHANVRIRKRSRNISLLCGRTQRYALCHYRHRPEHPVCAELLGARGTQHRSVRSKSPIRLATERQDPLPAGPWGLYCRSGRQQNRDLVFNVCPYHDCCP